MHSFTPKTSKSPKGTVQIKCSNNVLQLVFRVNGQRHYLSLGLIDTLDNRKIAELKAKAIESDITFGNFDPTLAKYKKKTVLSIVPEAPIIKKTEDTIYEISLIEIWEKFLKFKSNQCSPNTMALPYAQFTRYINQFPTQDLSKANEIRDYIIDNIPLNSSKRLLTRLKSCCDLAIENNLIQSNPFKGMAEKIKVPKRKKNDEFDIQPFSIEEREKILNAFKDNTFCKPRSGFKHNHYYPLVKFLFNTGCRPSEARALQWKHISTDFRFINFEQAVIDSDISRSEVIRQGLKTEEKRKFPCNESLQQFLESIKPSPTCNPEALIFPGHNRGILDFEAFRKTPWKQVLAGLEIEYRKPYQCRHTFITLALENGLDAKDVAKLVGNSPEIIYRHYAGNKRELFVPEF